MSTAASVPSCVTAVKAAPGSSQPANAATMRRHGPALARS